MKYRVAFSTTRYRVTQDCRRLESTQPGFNLIPRESRGIVKGTGCVAYDWNLHRKARWYRGATYERRRRWAFFFSLVRVAWRLVEKHFHRTFAYAQATIPMTLNGNSMLTDLHAITVYSIVLRVLLYECYEKDRGHRCRVSEDGRVMKNDDVMLWCWKRRKNWQECVKHRMSDLVRYRIDDLCR